MRLVFIDTSGRGHAQSLLEDKPRALSSHFKRLTDNSLLVSLGPCSDEDCCSSNKQLCYNSCGLQKEDCLEVPEWCQATYVLLA